MMSLLAGLALLSCAAVLFLVALPKEAGTVRPFLQADFAQGAYAVLIVFLGAAGMFTSIVSLAEMLG